MSIFSTTRKENRLDVPVYEGHVDASLAGMQSIVAESAKEVFQLQAGMYISDVIMEEQVMEGAAQPEVLLEGLVKDTWEKIRRIFTNLWSKIKAFFAKVKRQMSLIFSSGEEFIKKFKEEIRGKTSKGFSYNGYKFTLEDGKKYVATQYGRLSDEVNKAVDLKISETTTDGQEKSIRDNASGESHDLSAAKEKVISRLGHQDLSDVLKEAAAKFRNGSDEKEDIEDFSGNSKEELISMIEDGKKQISEIDALMKDTDAQMQRVLQSINKAKAKIEGMKIEAEGEKARLTAFASHKYSMAQYALSTGNSLFAVRIEAIKEAAKQAESVLKSFLRFKPAKEGFTGGEEHEETGSILESAMKWI